MIHMASQLFAAALILDEHFEGVEVKGYFLLFLINQLIPNTIQSAFNPRHAKIHELQPGPYR